LAVRALLALCLGSVLAVAAAGEAAWPRFHGLQGDNIASETGLLQAWPEAGPALLWTAAGLGQGYASVTVENGLIYTAGDIEPLNVITALDLDGKPLWRYEAGPFWRDPVAGARGTPVVDGERLYHENAHGALVCLDAKTGKKLWAVDLTQAFGGRGGAYGYAESPLLDGEHLICSPGGDAAMVALDRKTGATVWKSPSAGEPAGYATPILAQYKGLRLLLTMSERGLIGVNADSGDLLFKFELVNPRYVANCVTPVYHDGRVFISNGYGTGSVLLQLTVDGAKASVAPLWRCTALDNRHGGVILLNGSLYGASQENSKGLWCCVDWESGRLTYAEKGVGEGSATAAEGMLYILSERGKVGLVKAVPTEHKVISQFSLPPGGSGATWAHPVVCGGRLYVRQGDRLHCYDIRAK
jgi:outer membrane protein assembly factor BamB